MAAVVGCPPPGERLTPGQLPCRSWRHQRPRGRVRCSLDQAALALVLGVSGPFGFVGFHKVRA